jgi:pilus assembly protein CpaB
VNPRQRRGVLLLALAGLGAVAVFFAVLSYVSGVRSEAGQLTPVFRLADDVPAYHAVPDDLLEEVSIPEAAVPPSAVHSSDDLRGLVAANDLNAGSILQNDMLVPQPALKRGEREVAILVDAATGVAGRISPQSVVDIYATFQGDRKSCAALLVPKARIVATGSQRRSPGGTGNSDPKDVLPVTFALGSAEARKLVYAESFAEEVRLALVSVDEKRSGASDTSCTLPSGVAP